MTDAISATGGATVPLATSTDSTNEPVARDQTELAETAGAFAAPEGSTDGSGREGEGDPTVFEVPAVEVVRQIGEEARSISRDYERTIERLRSREPDIPSQVERLRAERETSNQARSNQPQLSDADRQAIFESVNQAQARLTAQLANTLSIGLSNALNYYDSFSTSRNEARNGR